MQTVIHNSRWLALACAFALLVACQSIQPPLPVCSQAVEGASEVFRTTSPDGGLEFTLNKDSRGQLSYWVVQQGQPVLEASPLGLLATSHDLRCGVSITQSETREVSGTYSMLVGKRRERSFHANELTLALRTNTGAPAEFIARAQDDGVAFRYRLLGSGPVTVHVETTGFAIAQRAASRILTRPYDAGWLGYLFSAGSYEQPPELLDVGTATSRSGFAFPALFELDRDEDHYALITEADLDGTYVGSRLSGEPADNLYRLRFPDPREGNGVGEVTATNQLPLTTPWRVISAGSLANIIETTIVDDVSAPSVVEDTSWIRPGRVAWSWFSQGTGDRELQSEYIEFAEEFGWDYVLIDWQWDTWESAEASIQSLVRQADAAGTKLMLWYNSAGEHSPIPMTTPKHRMLDRGIRRAEMYKLSKWGIAGIKVDFFQSDKQDRIQQYIDILEDAKDFRLLVNFHGSTIPRGWQRTYPNLLTQEAAAGSEFYIPLNNVLGDRAPTALHNVHNILGRNVVGSMDYTPVAFEAALERKQLPYAHSLALAVLFESGLQHFAGRADANPNAGYRAHFASYPFLADFMSTVPVVWDDTRLLSADLDSHVILARRRGETWYVAGIQASNAEQEHTVLPGFLPAGSYELQLIEQDQGADTLRQSRFEVTSSTQLRLKLPARGGFTAVFRPFSPASDVRSASSNRTFDH